MVWNLWCASSIVGIWPRFIEPNFLELTKVNLPIPYLPKVLDGLKILQFSDLHWNKNISDSFLEKLIRKINSQKADFIFFTGDLLSRSKLEDEKRLKMFLSSLHAGVGCYAILGNHDYEQFVTLNESGDYDVERVSHSTLGQGFKRLFSSKKVSGYVSNEAKKVKLHQGLLSVFAATSFQLLHNCSKLVACKGTFLNICGVGEYILGQLDQKSTFSKYEEAYPGIILMHNPDGISLLKNCPGELILSGHTHGGQVNLPFIWKKLTYMENYSLKRGLKRENGKWLYINRGIGSVMPFRWFSRPEITLISLKRGDDL